MKMLKQLTILNALTPMCFGIAMVATARYDAAPTVFLFAVTALGMLIPNLIAPVFLWKRFGWESLIPLTTLIVAISVCALAGNAGARLMLAGTPVQPVSFLKGAKKTELEAVAKALLRQGRDSTIDARLRELKFSTVSVDTLRQVVTFEHSFRGTWYEYMYAANGLPPNYSSSPRLTEQEIGNWGALHRIAFESGREAGTHPRGLGFDPAMAAQFLEAALGDSLMADLRTRGSRRISPHEKELVLTALNEQCAVGSRLVENDAITLERRPSVLHAGVITISGDDYAWWVMSLIDSCLKSGVLTRAPDGRHLRLKPGLTDVEQHEVEWIHVGLMNLIYGELLNARDHVYDRQLAEHWYFREW